MRNLKRVIAGVIGVIICASTLAGCGTAASADVTALSEATQLPTNGVVTKEQLATLKGKTGTYSFKGHSGDIEYTWLYDAAQIKNPTDQHLDLTIDETGSSIDSVKKAANKAAYALSLKIGKFELAGSPKLSITLPAKWKADRVAVVTGQDGELRQVSGAKPTVSTTKKSTTIVSTITVTNKTLYIVGGSSRAKSDKSDKKESSHSGDEAGSDSDGSGSGETGTGDGASGSSNGTSSSAGGQSGNSTSGKASSDNNSISVTMSIDVLTLVGHMNDVKASKRSYVPKSGWILPATKVTMKKGQSVYDALVSVTKSKHIQMESRWTPMYGSYYVSGINQLYEFDGGNLSGWMYNVDGWYPNYGASSYTSLHNGSVIQWRYTRDLGHDLGTNVAGE